MSRIQIIIDSIAGAVGAVLGFMYGEVNGLFRALIAFMILDYVSGVLVAIAEKKLSSAVGFKGIAEKAADTCVPVGRSYRRHLCTWRCACRYDGGNAFLYR